ncbi:MAG: magnesium transporter [Rhodobacteraceae bacterium]|nr:magnesium transporter [Paracoccaceae bacterium]
MQDQITPDDAYTDPDSGDGAYTLDTVAIDAILDAVEAGDQPRLIALLEPLHSADIADVLEQISGSERESLLLLWGTGFDGDVLSELDENLRADLIETLPPEVMSSALKDLESDDVVDLVEDLEEPQQNRILEALDQTDRVAVEQSLQYPEESAGRLMQRELVMAPAHWTVGDAIDHLRSETDLPYRFYVVVIVDPKMQPIGKVALSDLLSSPRETMLATIMDEHFHVIPVTQSQEDVAYAFNQYHMVSAPVVDERGRLVGVITIDDAMLVLDEEAEEDLRLLNGVGDESLTDSVLDTTRQRFPWLGVNLITAVLASVVISQFSDTIEAIVALAVLMPIVASMGGNAGTQTLTVAVRALATKDLTASNAMRVIRREVMVGLLNGLVFAVIIGAVGVAWFGSPMLGVVLGLAMIANLLIAGMAGILIPIALTKLKIDPALASGAFVTTVTDVVGFFAFLGLAAVMLT